MPSRRHRVTRGDDYRSIVRKGNRVGGVYCITHAVFHVSTAHNELAEPMQTAPLARFGFIISKAVGNAVTRNLVRRRLKAIAERAIAEGFTGADVVFRVLPSAAQASFAELETEVFKSLKRAETPRPRKVADR